MIAREAKMLEPQGARIGGRVHHRAHLLQNENVSAQWKANLDPE
jgi:hypothetical protein